LSGSVSQSVDVMSGEFQKVVVSETVPFEVRFVDMAVMFAADSVTGRRI
jgi:hypothetical protein